MPLRPNFFERLAIGWGMVPGLLLDFGLTGFMVTAMIGAGEIDLFRKMDRGPANLEDLAQRTGTDPRALYNLLKVMKNLGYVDEKDGRYALSKYAHKSLPVSDIHKMTPFFKAQILRSVEGVEKALTEAPEDGVFGWEAVREGEVGRSYQETMRWLAGGTVDEVVSKIKLHRSDARMIDIGGSHGLYCVEMCRKYPDMQATVVDWPIGIENAGKTLQENTDVADRIDTVEADFLKDELPGDYDFAFLGNIVHGNSPDQNRELFRKIGEATRDRAVLGILDQFDNISGTRFTRTVSSLVGWNLFLFSNGRAYDIADVKSWLEEAGFPKTRLYNLKKTPGFSLLLAKTG
ncbi:MAG: methyltransferase [Saprospiraceae bacterium]|nr:methyltransferase [Saprospiraceae bacterium]